MTPTFTGKLEMQQDGSVKMYLKATPPFGDGDYQVYSRLGRKDWKLISYKHQIADPASFGDEPIQNRHPVWAEESWEAGGTRYTQDVYVAGVGGCR